MSKGLVICFEGGDGTGKSTLAQHTVEYFGEGKAVLAKNPGSTPLGQELRKLIKTRKDIEIDKFTEQILFMADHSAFMYNVLIPTIERGAHVVCDRHDLIGNIAYGFAGGQNKVKMYNMRRLFHGLPRIDVLFMLHASPGVTRGRRQSRDEDCKIEARGDTYLSSADMIYDATAKGHNDKAVTELSDEIIRMAHKVIHMNVDPSLEDVKRELNRHLDALLNS